MPKFRLEFDMDNAAFADDPTEVARVVESVAADLRRAPYPSGAPVRDVNGNTVGRWEVVDNGEG